jgi:sulfite exporter TauE/SafE/copper chaperone CopZ
VEHETRTVKLRVGGMFCASCELLLSRALKKTRGVKSAKVSYRGGWAEIGYDPLAADLSDLRVAVESAGYDLSPDDAPARTDWRRAAGLLIIILALYVTLSHFGILNLLTPGRLAEAGLGYGMLFVVGLVTSVHCLAMCGGLNLSQTVGRSGLAPAALYNLGRVVSYTAVGFGVGALGSAISFTAAAQGALKLAAGVFMVIMGVNMLGIFPPLRKLAWFPPRLRSGGQSPLFVGLLNGLMPCGPLQSMQIYALATGSPIKGALSMLLFSLGTVPLMFGLGALSSGLGKRFSRQVMTAGAALVAALGLSMLAQGWSLSGLPSLFSMNVTRPLQGENTVTLENGVQVVHSTLQSWRYPAITVQAGLPVKWIIDAPKGSINGCNKAIHIPEYDIEYRFKTEENIIEFTPTRTGNFLYSCWMGMIRSTITVVDGG